MPDLDIAQYLCPRSNHDSVSNFWVAIADLIARPPERHVVEQGHIVINDGGLADHETGRMIEEDAPPDASGGMNIGLEDRG